MSRGPRVAIAVAVAFASAAGVASFALVRDRNAETRAVIDETAGTYRGVRLGDSAAAVRREFGEPARDPGFAPAGESPADVGVPESIPGSGDLMKYEGVAFLVDRDRGVFAMLIAEDGAATTRGVAIGDRIEEAHAAYALRCIDVAGGGSLFGGQETYPSCQATLGRVRMWFGRDPIRSITLLSLRG